MSFELYALWVSILLGLIYLSAASFSFKAQVGNPYSVGSSDQALTPTGVAARLQRAQSNFNGTFPYFAACALIVHVTDSSGDLSYWGCLLYVTVRLG